MKSFIAKKLSAALDNVVIFAKIHNLFENLELCFVLFFGARVASLTALMYGRTLKQIRMRKQ